MQGGKIIPMYIGMMLPGGILAWPAGSASRRGDRPRESAIRNPQSAIGCGLQPALCFPRPPWSVRNKHVRTKYNSHIDWFDINLPWDKRDAIEVTIIEPPKAKKP